MTLKLLAVLVALGASLPAHAQKMYRCGSTYQDRPCQEQEGKVVGQMSSQTGSGTAGDKECVQRGVTAQKIMWAREGGASLERVLADTQLQAGASRQLVEEVFRRRGSSASVRTEVEADCVQEKARQAQASALRAQADALDPGRAASPATAPVRQFPAEQAPVPTGPSASDTRALLLACRSLDDRLREIAARQRAGASAREIESLKEQQRKVAKRFEEDACAAVLR